MRSIRLALEAMESRSLPSSLLAYHAPTGHQPVSTLCVRHDEPISHHQDHDGQYTDTEPRARTPASSALSGWLAGQVRTTLLSKNVDAGMKYSLSGKASMAGLGEVALDGFVQGTGFTSHGHAAGQLTLTSMTDTHSTLTVTLTGPTQGSFVVLPSAWTVHVVHGTGSFSHIRGNAAMTLNISMGDSLPNHGAFHGSI